MTKNIKDNIKRVRYNIAEAAIKSGRKPEDILLLAVSKTKPAEDIQAAMAEGIRDFGENRVQELCRKKDYFGDLADFHQIGTLQSNKVKYLIGRTKLIHSVDSLKLLQEINRISQRYGKVTQVLIQVNIGDEPQKSGVSKSGLFELVESCAEFSNVQIRGLMAIPPVSENPEKTRPYFRNLFDLSVEIASKKIYNVSMDFLSMGMSHDYEIAISEGANIVRIGSAIFGSRHYPALNDTTF